MVLRPQPPDDQLSAHLPAILDGSGPVLLDFDHTLFRGNSTECFIAFCKPNAMVALIDFAIRVCLPWKLLPVAHPFRVLDYLCCMVIIALMPWNLWRWRRVAPMIFAQHADPQVRALADAAGPDRVQVISFGMQFIIAPLISSTPYSAGLIATPMRAAAEVFAGGKRALARYHLSDEQIAAAAFITDSEHDRDLLDVCRTGVLISPKGAVNRARNSLYLPLRYMAGAKYPKRYVLDQTLFVDWALAVLATSFSLSSLAAHAVISAFFLLSTMCVYEIGYFENDMKPSAGELRLRQSAAVPDFRGYPIEPAAWFWSAALFLAGGLSLQWLGEGADWGPLALRWAGYLLILRLCFWIYNRSALAARIPLYGVLQVLKYGAIFLVLAPTVPGVILVVSQIAVMWSSYALYRLRGHEDVVPKDWIRLALFVSGVAVVALTRTDFIAANSFALLACLTWLLARAVRKPLARTLRRVHLGV